ncbi:MAG TPA: crossover junction endodeoxyribonuclease RuvC [Gemmataceae bacterium]|nr:crossover junction endodeoxyribonuclease RuvC [Gemmataceae bacterium]
MADLSSPKTEVRILGIDPGLQITGYAVVDAGTRGPVICEAGLIRSSEGSVKPELDQRLRVLYNGIEDLLNQFHPQTVVVEQLYAHYLHPRTAILMGHARGVILLAASRRDLRVVSYSATRIKKTITGNGRAPKEQVQRTIQREFGLSQLPDPPDVADALAAALCHFYVQKLPV